MEYLDLILFVHGMYLLSQYVHNHELQQRKALQTLQLHSTNLINLSYTRYAMKHSLWVLLFWARRVTRVIQIIIEWVIIIKIGLGSRNQFRRYLLQTPVMVFIIKIVSLFKTHNCPFFLNKMYSGLNSPVWFSCSIRLSQG